MRYHYIAFEPSGKVIEGEVEGNEPADVLAFLAGKGLRPITIQQADIQIASKEHRFFGQKITVTDKVFLTKYLALMLKVGTDLFRAIDILIADFDKPVMKAFLVEVRRSLERGAPFHSTFAKYPSFFSETFVSLIKAGEASGNLDRVFEDLSDALEKENELRSRIKGALIYPILLLIMAVVILTFLVTFALPRIAEVFTGSGFEPPLFSRVVFSFGLFLGKYIWPLLGAGIVVIAGLGFFLFKTTSGRTVLQRVIRALPVAHSIVEKIALQRFASTLASLLKSGLPIIDALEITANAIGNESMSQGLRRVAREGVSRGETIGDAFKHEAVFPRVVVNLIAISEKAGHLDEILNTLADFYDMEVGRALKTFVAFVEPALLTMIGLVVAVIALAIIMPIYQLVGQF